MREDAAPSFDSWKLRLERATPVQLQIELREFLRVLNVLGTPLIDGPNVHFVYYDPAAEHVALAGEFNEWGRNDDAIPMRRLRDTPLFFHTLTVPGSTRLEYKFIVDGQWKPDPLGQHKVDNGIGSQNTFFVVGDFSDPPELEPVAGIPRGRIEEFEFESELLRNRRRVYVYLPAAYDRDSASPFPALYVHDGGEYLERARIATVLDNLIHGRDLPPLLAVMIDPVDRTLEYRANDAYRDFLCDEFIPMIDLRYRTIDHRDQRGVMGASLGGLISAYAALSRPQLFARVAGQSSALQYEEERLASMVTAIADTPIRFYLDVGTYEPRFIPAHLRFVALLKQKGWPCCYQEIAGGHNWTNWRAHLKDLLIYLWAPASS